MKKIPGKETDETVKQARSSTGERQALTLEADGSTPSAPTTRLVGVFRLLPGLSPADLDEAEKTVLTALADYRKGKIGGGFYEVRIP